MIDDKTLNEIEESICDLKSGRSDLALTRLRALRDGVPPPVVSIMRRLLLLEFKLVGWATANLISDNLLLVEGAALTVNDSVVGQIDPVRIRIYPPGLLEATKGVSRE